ncbi:MAG: hypothetical protein KJT01_10750, partial [Gemmatimonadetes bacterium]|nr:hypothetical protein [Gemmatimonadota bacterium]
MQALLRGIPASPGIVVGPVHILRWEVPEVPSRVVADAEIADELARLHEALARARERLDLLAQRAEEKAGSTEAAIFAAQRAILDDTALAAGVETLIRQHLAAEKAVDVV